MKNGSSSGSPGATGGGGDGGDAVNRLQADAGKLMQELAGLSARLKAAGESAAGAAAGGDVSGASDQLNAIRERLSSLSADSQQTLQQLDRSVRANPYLWIIGALGLGWLLGKVTRS